jgi:hypothetical protein
MERVAPTVVHNPAHLMVLALHLRPLETALLIDCGISNALGELIYLV